ncbi:MAG: ABC-2 transporter permease [Eubacteriales bacterium]|nr:ABC-2 transporter permease [Eubacteriales bacterium]MDY3332641.1 ABC-2 transporter permease [Gallibacter sp.]
MLDLMKKDFLITKKIAIIAIIISLVVPLLRTMESIPTIAFVSVMSILMGMLFISNIYESEDKSPKAAAMMTTIGYSRTMQIVERYLLAFIVFIFCNLIYYTETGLLNLRDSIEISDILIAFFAFSLVMSLYLGLTTKFGIKLGRLLSMLIIFFVSMGPALLAKFNIKISLKFLYGVSMNEVVMVLTVFGILLYMISLVFSIKVYSKKEL